MDLVSVLDYERYAEVHLPSLYWRFFSEGAIGSQTVKRNQSGFERLRLRPRVLRNVSRLETETTIQGEKIAFPICVAPTASHCLAHSDGELATAKAAAGLGTCMTLSHVANKSLEAVAEAAGEGLRWLQLYIFRDRTTIVKLVRRAEAAGYKALAVTIDHPVIGKRRTPLTTLPPGLHMPNVFDESDVVRREDMFWQLREQIDGSLTWDDVEWVQSITQLPVVVKGIHTAEDAQEAVKRGIRGVWVSNHGGRQLDGVPGTIEVLPEIVKAVDGKAEVYLDGGIRYGTDVLKALALGARAVFVGRPVLWGLAHSGEKGASRVLQILRDEFQTAMALAGCAKLTDIGSSLVVHESHYWSNL
eukprot:m.63327 g.63327  ORF g.63327 m.63327 type:complete len:359 (+) comp35166_c0_seq2:22-1098(+)